MLLKCLFTLISIYLSQQVKCEQYINTEYHTVHPQYEQALLQVTNAIKYMTMINDFNLPI